MSLKAKADPVAPSIQLLPVAAVISLGHELHNRFACSWVHLAYL